MIRRLWDLMPEGTVKHQLRRWTPLLSPRRSAGFRAGVRALAEQVEGIDLRRAAVDGDRTSKIELVDGTVFYGHLSEPADLSVYAWLSRDCRARIPAACAKLACDIVCRYRYPHADVTCAPPYPASQRGAMHKQHQDTLADVTTITETEREQLRARFAIRPGHVVIDAGAFIGLGAMRIARMVGERGKVVSVEAHPENLRLLRRNIEANGVSNVEIVGCGVWKEPGEYRLRCDSIQRNSLVGGVITEDNDIVVPTTTIDEVARKSNLPRVNLVSITINGAEPEAVEGMSETLQNHSPNILLAGWYKREGRPIHELITGTLSNRGYRTLVGPMGRVYAWKP